MTHLLELTDKYINNILLLFILSTSFCVLMLFYEDLELEKAYQDKYDSLVLADRVRQTSDDLTRMVRTYVVTKDPRYKKFFDEIIRIREGMAPRPDNLTGIYWDLVTDEAELPVSAQFSESLISLMMSAGFSYKEFELLQQAKNKSDALVGLEKMAMEAVEVDTLSLPQHYDAIMMLHDTIYHNRKRDIMSAVADFQNAVSERTSFQIESIKERKQSYVVWSVVSLMVFLLLLGRIAYTNADKREFNY